MCRTLGQRHHLEILTFCNIENDLGTSVRDKLFLGSICRKFLFGNCINIVACHLPRAPSYGGVRTWVEGSQMRGDRALARASNLLGYKEYMPYELPIP